MPVTITSRLKKALIEILEDANTTAKERLEAARLLADIEGNRRALKGKQTKKKGSMSVLG